MSEFPLEIEVKNEKGRKVQQVIWLKPLTFSQILILAERYKVAPNVVISEILDKVMTNQSMLFKDKIVEKKVKVIVCPFCLGEFMDVSNFELHIVKEHPEIYSIIQKKMVGAL